MNVGKFQNHYVNKYLSYRDLEDTKSIFLNWVIGNLIQFEVVFKFTLTSYQQS